MSLETFDARISSSFACQFIGGSNTNNMDLLLKYDPAMQQSVTLWRASNSAWHEASQTVQTPNTLKLGEGISIQTREHGSLVHDKPGSPPSFRPACPPPLSQPSAPFALRASPPTPSVPGSPTGLRVVSSKP
jgi:hypothetical protein